LIIVVLRRNILTMTRFAFAFHLAMDSEMYAAGRANVRSGVLATTDLLLTLNPGESLAVIARVRGEGGDWYRVALADGMTGYVLGSLLESRGPPPPAPPMSVPASTANVEWALRLAGGGEPVVVGAQ
jgi:uncharacterized protein YgiM (DUF1202 family)